MIGKTLGPYQISAKLGQGGMGEVWRATDTKLGREVAIKLLPPQLAEDPERRQRFEREARAVAALNHPNIVTIYTVDEFDGRPLLVMEYVDGQTLTERIPEGGMPLAQLLDIAIPLSDALATAHTQGITHRDLKPPNVMVDTQGRVKVLDFGLAKLLEAQADHGDDTLAVDITGEGRILGTASYMSPEQAEGREVDARSDVFTLGILLYQMATGQKPFVGDTPISTITSILRDDPQPVAELKPDLPAQLGRIIRRCLEKSPDGRYDTAKGLKFELESLRDDTTDLSAVSPSRPASIPKWPLALGAVVILALLAILIFREGEPRESGGTRAVSATQSTVTAVEENRTIVVLPFENLGEADDEYFADGITDEITTRLVGTEGLDVLSRSSARQYDRAGKSMRDIANDLGVDYVLEGSIRWQRTSDGGSIVRVSPLLVLAPQDRQLWAQSFDRSMEEIFAIETEIATAVAREVGGVLRPESAADVEPPTSDMRAYQLFLRAKELVERGAMVRSDLQISERLLDEALELDPQFAEAWGLYARIQAGYCHYNWDRTPERLQRAYNAAATTATLEPNSSLAHLTLGFVYYWGEKRLREASLELEKALELRPGDAQILEFLGYVLRRQGRNEEALALFQQVQELSPNSLIMEYVVGETLTMLGRNEEALSHANRAIEIDPAAALGYLNKSQALRLLGDLEGAIDELGNIPSPTPESRLLAYRTLRDAVRLDDAEQSAEAMPEYLSLQYNDQCRSLFRAEIAHMREGQEAASALYEQAVEVLRRAVAELPGQANPLSTLALALAGAGQCEEALAAAERAVTLFPADNDLWIRSFRHWDLARVQLLCGRPDAAEESIRKVLAGENDTISVEYLRAAPLYGRDSPVPEFRAIASMDL